MQLKPRIFAAIAATVTAVAALGLAVALPVTAQSIPVAFEQPATVNDAEVESFAAAVVEVKRVTDAYLPLLAQTQTAADKDVVEDAAFAEIQQIVESRGFTVLRFNEILALAHLSPDLVDRIRMHLP